MFRIKDERFPHKWGFSLRFNEASTLPGSSESSHTSRCRQARVRGFAPLGCSELWGEPLVAGELLHSSQSLPSCPVIKPETHSLTHIATRTHLKSCLKCDRTYYSKLIPSLLFILLGACIRLKLWILDPNFFTHLPLQHLFKYLHSVQKYWGRPRRCSQRQVQTPANRCPLNPSSARCAPGLQQIPACTAALPWPHCWGTWHTGISSLHQCHPTPREHSHITFLISALDSVWSSSRDCSSLIFSPSSSLSCTHLAFEDTRLGAKCKSID